MAKAVAAKVMRAVVMVAKLMRAVAVQAVLSVAMVMDMVESNLMPTTIRPNLCRFCL